MQSEYIFFNTKTITLERYSSTSVVCIYLAKWVCTTNSGIHLRAFGVPFAQWIRLDVCSIFDMHQCLSKGPLVLILNIYLNFQSTQLTPPKRTRAPTRNVNCQCCCQRSDSLGEKLSSFRTVNITHSRAHCYAQFVLKCLLTKRMRFEITSNCSES